MKVFLALMLFTLSLIAGCSPSSGDTVNGTWNEPSAREMRIVVTYSDNQNFMPTGWVYSANYSIKDKILTLDYTSTSVPYVEKYERI